MSKVRIQGEKVRRYILDNVTANPTDITKVTADHFKITRQAVNKHLQKLVNEGVLTREGRTRCSYKFAPLAHWQKTYPLTEALAEDQVWRLDVAPTLGSIPNNTADIWHYGFTEMFNNAIDHSEGHKITVDFSKTAVATRIILFDDGIGIFKKIQAAMGLLDERHAVLELAKGKFTTDPARHTGEGIFFASRMFDDFIILSGGVYFSHALDKKEDWIMEREEFSSGTAVFMTLNNHTARTVKKVFDKFTSDDDYGFTKTVVPVRLAQYGDDNLVSRSQAKRLLTRVDRFKTVMLDFEGVDTVGQGFADEVFRVFAAQHPEISLTDLNANPEVKRMISRARNRE